MHTSSFFKIFPPPKFMFMKYAGLDISDEAIHCLEYASTSAGIKISKYARTELPAGLIDGGEIKDAKRLGEILTAFDKEHDLSYVKVSLPEEKMYLFQTDVPSANPRAMLQNIEFKLEENVPLSAPDAVFYFDLMPAAVSGGALRASVSVAPRTYVEDYIALLRGAGISPVAFEVIPKSIARAVVPPHTDATKLLIYMMHGKTGIYIVSANVVCFTSTLGEGSAADSADARNTYVASLSKEINRVYAYWISRGGNQPAIDEILLAGHEAPLFENALQNVVVGAAVPVRVAQVWKNVFNLDRYVPPISHDDSLDYVVAAGLALNQ